MQSSSPSLLPPLTIVIVTHNSSNVLTRCLDSLPSEHPVIVVDNASTDNTVSLAQPYPQVSCIPLPQNIGFGPANNVALDDIATPFALLLNPDTELQSDTIPLLLQAAERYENAAILAPQLEYQDGRLQHSYKNSIFDRDKAMAYVEPEGDVCADFLSGALWLLRMRCLEETGGFDPDIFLYYEDDDLCIRLRKQGYALVLIHEARALHLCGQSSPVNYSSLYTKNWHMAWSRLYLEQKYRNRRKAYAHAYAQFFLYLGKTVGYVAILRGKKAVRSLGRCMASLQFLVEGLSRRRFSEGE